MGPFSGLCLLLHVFNLMACSSALKSHYGTDFYVGLITGYSGVTPDNITVDIASQDTGMVHVYVPLLNQNRTKTLRKGLTSITIDQSTGQTGNFQEKQGCHITTTVPVAVYVSAHISDNRETYMALPTASLGNSYMVASYQPLDTYKSEILIMSTSANTVLNVSGNGVKHLGKLDATQIADVSDLTGTIISSTNPVGVISGASCANIPHDVIYCDEIVEQMFPVNAWTDMYIVPPIPPKTGYFVRVQTMDSLHVCLKNSSRQICRQMSPKTYSQFRLETEPAVIFSNGSCNFGVIQYGVGQEFDDIPGDPFMTVIPGVKNYISSYYFAVPSLYSKFSNFLTVIIKASETDGLLLDESPLRIMYNYTVITPLGPYVVFISRISPGFHVVRHKNTSVEFGALLYGLTSYAGYGYSVGMKYPNELIAPTEAAATSTTTKPKTTTPPTTTPSQKCYHCNDMTSLEVCDVVKTCSGNEVCYAERFTTQSGTLYRSGCMNTNNCTNGSTTSAGCLQCCHDNYCNNKGCGDNRFPDRLDRGPMCFDCQHVLNDIELCNKVTMCRIDEICRFEQFSWGKDYHYKMGCTSKTCTSMTRSVLPGRLRRSTPLCATCCSDDFCNTNCTTNGSVDPGQVIVG